MVHQTVTLAELIEHLGGVQTVAEAFNVTPSAVYSWRSADYVPAVHQLRMLQLAVIHKSAWRPRGWDRAVQLRVDPDSPLARTRGLAA